jgi:beta-glucanase (GH16 family)
MLARAEVKMIIPGILGLLALLAAPACKDDDTGSASIPPPVTVTPVDKNWTFETTPTFVDEFNYTGAPNSAMWGYDTGGSGWGNNELQYYTNDIKNAYVSNGVLTIAALKENKENREYTSARLVSRNKGDFLYGRIEVKAKLPTGKGTWPAIWMLPTDWLYGDWPKSGEIDIMEHVGYDQDNIVVSVHTESYNHAKKTQKSGTKKVAGVSNEFHVYRVDWTPYAVRGYVDDQRVLEFVNDGKGYASWPFDKKFHILLNVAFGGDWGGAMGIDASVLPQKMEIDYVKVFKMIEK